MGRLFGYVRVSTIEQNTDRQLIAMKDRGIAAKHIYVDKQSGKDFARPAYTRLVRRLRSGDVLIVKSIDRLGRNYRDVLEQWRILSKEKGVDIVVLDMPLLDTTKSKDLLGTFISDLVLQLLSFVSESERQNIRQRQAEGIAAAKLRNVQFGRPPKQVPDNFMELVSEWQAGLYTMDVLASQCGMSKSTVYRKLKSEAVMVQQKSPSQ